MKRILSNPWKELNSKPIFSFFFPRVYGCTLEVADIRDGKGCQHLKKKKKETKKKDCYPIEFFCLLYTPHM